MRATALVEGEAAVVEEGMRGVYEAAVVAEGGVVRGLGRRHERTEPPNKRSNHRSDVGTTGASMASSRLDPATKRDESRSIRSSPRGRARRREKERESINLQQHSQTSTPQESASTVREAAFVINDLLMV